MSLQAYLAFVAAASTLILLPGPNVALIVGTSLAHGRRTGLAVVAGSNSAMVLQLGAMGFGLAALLAQASYLFAALRWVGVAYLLVLGAKAFLSKADELATRRAAPSLPSAFWRGFAVSLTNPKTLLFYGAFLPQFIDPRGDGARQLLILAVTFLFLAAVFDSGWAIMATRLRGLLALRPRLRGRLTGTCMIGAAVGLALAHERRSMDTLFEAGPVPGGFVLGVERSMAGQGWRHRLDAGRSRTGLAIAQAHGLPDLLARILASRGVDVATCETYLAPTLRGLMPDPDVLTDMVAAVGRIARAVVEGKKIGIIGDYDVDGATSVALLADYLRAAGIVCEIHIPDRIREGYGPSVEAVDRLAASGVSLLVTVDCGSASHLPLGHAQSLGLDTLVLDHHQIASPFPPTCAIVNPNRPDDLSGLGSLCAAGVVFMVLVGLHRRLKATGFWNGRLAPDLLAGLDLVALATVADVVPLTGLNRAFVVKGLEVMRRRMRPGLAALCDVAGTDGPPTTFHLGYLLGPRVNAGGRVGDATLGARLLMTEDPLEAARIAADLDRLNRDRRTIEAEALDQAEAEALTMLGTDSDHPVLIAAREGWHPGVMGLVAARLKERFGRPAFAIALAGAVGTGSGRSIAGADLGQAVRACVEAGLLHRGGGHAMAAGVTMDAGGVAAFKTFMNEHLGATMRALSGRDVLLVDGTLSAAAATPDLVAMLDRAGPFGAGSPEPVLIFPHHRVLDLDVVGADHLRLTVAGPDGARLRCVAFRAARTPMADALSTTRGRLVHLAGTLTVNRHGGGNPRAELRLIDAVMAG